VVERPLRALRRSIIRGQPLPTLSAAGVDADEVSRMGDFVPPLVWFRDPDGNTLMVASGRTDRQGADRVPRLSPSRTAASPVPASRLQQSSPAARSVVRIESKLSSRSWAALSPDLVELPGVSMLM
jgi:hypothetical protein